MLLYLEPIIAVAAFSVFFGYHLWYFFQVKRQPSATSIGFNNHARSIWVKHIRDNNLDILAIQTMRNWIMAATFSASTSILLALGILSYSLTIDGVNDVAHQFNIFGSRSHAVLLFKALLLAIDFIFAFIAFALAVRFYNHASFLINIPKNYNLSINSKYDISAINQAALCYNLGMRAYYLSIPLAFWILGPLWMFICALIVTYMVYKLDHGI